MGYPRENGSVGIRNYIGVISTVACGNEVARWSSMDLDGVKVFTHGQGCAQTVPDLERVSRTLISLGGHPNLAGVVVVGLGCESVDADSIADGISSSSGKWVETFITQDLGGVEKAREAISSKLEEMKGTLLPGKREEADISSLLLGIKCGGSDTTSGIASNPALGSAVNLFLDMGGSVAFGETTEIIGAEDMIVSRGRTGEVREKLLNAILSMEQRVKRMGVDMRGGQPTGGNIEGGLSTIEEKSLGAAIKTGTRPIDGVIDYGNKIEGSGLYMVDSPGREPEFLTGIAASGAQMMAFTTGKGAPHNFPFMPVVKITGNPRTANILRSHIDVDLSVMLKGSMTIQSAGEKILGEMMEVASGKVTKAEITGYDGSMNIYTTGPVI
jgi:altronate dehydratase large subunit